MGGFGGMGGMGNMQQMASQLMNNPQAMQQMLNSPIMQQLLNNPELLRNMMMSNPQIRTIIEQNPEVGHVLNDPQMLRQMLEIQRNPELMREMMRNTDRAMSNIEAHPEGFNALRRLYSTVQEPLMDAATQSATSTNPFASLFGGPSAFAGSAPAASATSESVPATPNAAPLPNPWAPGNALPLSLLLLRSISPPLRYMTSGCSTSHVHPQPTHENTISHTQRSC